MFGGKILALAIRETERLIEISIDAGISRAKDIATSAAKGISAGIEAATNIVTSSSAAVSSSQAINLAIVGSSAAVATGTFAAINNNNAFQNIGGVEHTELSANQQRQKFQNTHGVSSEYISDRFYRRDGIGLDIGADDFNVIMRQLGREYPNLYELQTGLRGGGILSDAIYDTINFYRYLTPIGLAMVLLPSSLGIRGSLGIFALTLGKSYIWPGRYNRMQYIQSNPNDSIAHSMGQWWNNNRDRRDDGDMDHFGGGGWHMQMV